jgi:hypothetical protein
MKYTKYNYIFLFIIIILAVCLTIYLINFIENKKSVDKNIEQFLPGIKKMYRPYIRNARVYGTNKMNIISNKSKVALKKWGII